jgi:hypothetical protein
VARERTTHQTNSTHMCPEQESNPANSGERRALTHYATHDINILEVVEHSRSPRALQLPECLYQYIDTSSRFILLIKYFEAMK